jgi:hypothetical protein
LPFCRTYSDAVGPENAKKYQTLVFLAGSASAEFFADIGLCPWEAVKVCAPSRGTFCIPNMQHIQLTQTCIETYLFSPFYTVLQVCDAWHAAFVPLLLIRRWLPMQVKVQTNPGFAKGLMDGFPKFVSQEGYAG